MIIGLDVGSTTTKIVSYSNGKLYAKTKSKAFDAITSATGAFGKLLIENRINISDIEKINLTGVGAFRIESNIFNIKTHHIDEITSIGLGGKELSKLDNILIVNIGTGTAIISVNENIINHVGGSGIGGGTILGLAKSFLNITDFNTLIELGKNGKIENIDLQIKDILNKKISFLDMDTTVSNFGKNLETASKADIAKGIFNMVFQVIGMLAVFSAKGCNQNNIVFTGNGSKNEIGKVILKQIAQMYKMNFHFPENSEYATAIGSTLYAS